MNEAASNEKEMVDEGPASNLTSNGSALLIIDGVIDTRTPSSI